MTKVLMSADKPDGAKLEELLNQVIDDVCWKTQKLRAFMQTDAFRAQPDVQQSLTRATIFNNQEICRFLRAAVDRQDLTMAMLARVVGPDQGPTGTPRIGPGSGPMPSYAVEPMPDPIETTGHEEH